MDRLRQFLKKVIAVITQPEMRVLPGQLAFFFVVSLIPLVALIGTIFSSFSISIDSLTSTLSSAIPKEAATVLVKLISGKSMNFNIAIFFISAFILASNGAHSMIIASNEIYKIEAASWIRRRIKAILMTFVLVVLLLFLLLVPVFGGSIFTLLREYATNQNAVQFFYKVYCILKYPVSLLLVYFNIKLLYVMAPDKKIPSSSTTYGAIFTTVSWIIATEIYSFYVAKFTTYDIFYGSVANILILLLWVYLLAYIFVLGMAFNASNIFVYGNKDEKNTDKIEKDE